MRDSFQSSPGRRGHKSGEDGCMRSPLDSEKTEEDHAGVVHIGLKARNIVLLQL